MPDPDSWQEIAVELLDAAAMCLDMHTEAGAPALRFPSIGDPINPGCDYLSVWYSEWPAMSPTFPQTMSEPRLCEAPEWGALINLKLRWCGYPHLEPAGVATAKLPDPVEITAWSAKVNAAARTWQCCIPDLYAQGAVLTDPNMPGAPAFAAALPLIWQPLRPFREAMWVGLDWSMLIDLARCCPLPDIGSGS